MSPSSDLDWRKSSFSAVQGECIEVAWRKSSFTGSEGECVEVAPLPRGVAIRDSKNTEGPALTVPTLAWRSLIEARS